MRAQHTFSSLDGNAGSVSLQPPPHRWGSEPPLYVGQGSAPAKRAINLRWLAATILAGSTGAGLMTAVVVSTSDQGTTVSRPQFASPPPIDAAATGANVARMGDKLLQTYDAASGHQVLRLSTATKLGDHEVIKVEPFSRVIANLVLQHGEEASRVPSFASINRNPDPEPAAATPAPDPDEGEVSIKTHPIGDEPVGPDSGPTLTADQVAAGARAAASADGDAGPAAFPPQFLAQQDDAPDSLAYAPPDAADSSTIDIRIAPENVTQVGKTPSAESLSSSETTVPVKAGETLASILQRLGSSPDDAKAAATALGDAGNLQEGQRLRVAIVAPGPGEPRRPVRVAVYTGDAIEGAVALADDGGFVEVQAPGVNPDDGGDAVAAGDATTMSLYQSIYETALKQQVPEAVIPDLVRAFADVTDLSAPVRPGDTMELFYQEGSGHEGIRYAALGVGGELRRCYWYRPAGQESGDFFDEDGHSIHRLLLRKPLEAGVITSPFGYRRHPIFGVGRMHTGVDIADKLGTPIRATGDGMVVKITTTGGYGRHVEVQHANGYVTTYSHMGGFGPGIVVGKRVKMGQIVGYIGMTGFSTGPHVHYEVKINGNFVDPMRIKLPQTMDLADAALEQFKRRRDRIDEVMNRTSAVPGTAGAPRPLDGG
ncbi:M23 family metallopeptidase [Labrys wisconsinensis]|uniref:Murein DD-endopeptidase MepM/ murein hydrolase activator NlpD n=1 Tax=Labrys wisconsinensis TaxID=425677 RepID=A0ABU0J8S3_9HYPH|nr:M23 family metallopeptidase [Labrys wisconsinensis]MDQ0470679.1 murein DD-endopeptidase MepM/ murein hydrolase activator NlpD [Labrys wisconsinensis]